MNGDYRQVSKLQRNVVKCPVNAYSVRFEWTMYHKNASIIISDFLAELNYAIGKFISENSEPLMCRLEDGVVFLLMPNNDKVSWRPTVEACF